MRLIENSLLEEVSKYDHLFSQYASFPWGSDKAQVNISLSFSPNSEKSDTHAEKHTHTSLLMMQVSFVESDWDLLREQWPLAFGDADSISSLGMSA